MTAYRNTATAEKILNSNVDIAKIINSVKVELEYYVARKEAPNIPFISGSR